MSSKLVLKSIWSNGSCTYAITFKKMSSEDKREVEQLADKAGYTRNDDVWAPPRVVRGVSEFFHAMNKAGFCLEFDDPEDAPFDLQQLHLTADTRGALEWLGNFELYHLSGWAPVQAEGRLDGHHFYFRARGSYWRFELGGNERQTRSPRWWYEESWPSVTGFEAGYMTDEDAVCCILKAIDFYRNGDNRRFMPEHPEYERTILVGWSIGALSLHTAMIRLAISGHEVLRRMQELKIELPYTADRELKYVGGLPVRLIKPIAGR
ncbi:hypothetical protein [Allorhizobium taibaishanense]|uniref:Uncharacterized protein n=1 Tax=Allorhizobium taibaishanense TaxID=887144 RepID=A0A1Q9ABZ3_9HYPH|nr:hypothetical protein [Allorhizobium taibaishanense]MBB4010272.1 hypothetical protein [Allorhizobium taibaishanense]OLP52383.1 hypothetical protein BJF91_02320 [Allorhizobium taibaishanense]